MNARIQRRSSEAGFSLLELLISRGITLGVMAMACALITQSMQGRTRENNKADAIADTQQALTMMAREIGNAGFGLMTNGISADSTQTRIRVRANLNAYTNEPTNRAVTDANEDVIYTLARNPDGGGDMLVRTDVNLRVSRVLATRVDNVFFSYLDAAGLPTAPQNAARIRMDVRSELPQMMPMRSTYGTRDNNDFQQKPVVGLASDIVLRNSNLINY